VIDAHGGIVVSVRIGNAGPFDFILDTGASSSIVSADLARQIGAPIVARGEVVTSAGTELRDVVRLDAVSVAGARVESVLAPVCRPPASPRSDDTFAASSARTSSRRSTIPSTAVTIT
jgi:predicted aspartyl protease